MRTHYSAASVVCGATAGTRLPNRFAVGIKISGKTMEATNTDGSMMVPGKIRLVTRLRCAVPTQHAADDRIAAPEQQADYERAGDKQ